MANLEDQIAWEKECIERGSNAFFAKQDKIKAKGRELTEASRIVVKEKLRELALRIEGQANKARGNTGAYNRLLKSIAGVDNNYMRVGFIGLQTLLILIARGRKLKVTKLVSTIGTKLEAELKCQMFEALNPEYYSKVNESFKDNNVISAEHKQKVFAKKFIDFEYDWTPWTIQMKTHMGAKVLRCILHTMDDLLFLQRRIVQGKVDLFIDTTVAFDDWISEFERERSILFPQYLPLKIPPVEWVDFDTGAYYTPRMKIPLIKVKGKSARKFVREHLPKQHIKAINKLQNTAWCINNKVLAVQDKVFRNNLKVGIPSNQPVESTPFPEHLKLIPKDELTDDQAAELLAWKRLRKSQYTDETKRKGRVIGFRQAFLLAQELKDWERLYFAYNADFRGRIYCTTAGLSPQGADPAKALLTFADGLELGKNGVKWLAIHGANCFGIDKVTFEERVAWTKEHEFLIKAIVDDPIANMQWAEADKPYQFLAFCFEWEACDFGRNVKYKSSLPVGLDGSCNGLQHFSAMLRDHIGAAATNLTPTDTPQDIYNEVATVTKSKLVKLANEGDAYAKVWLQVGITRKCPKKPVMTLPYGATQQSAREYILEYVNDNWHKFNLVDKHKWDMAKYLTPILWTSIGEVVVAAVLAMKWLRKHVGKGHCKWVTIIGFPVFQHYQRFNLVDVKTQLEGTVHLYPLDQEKGEPNPYQQRNGVAPNFIHSMDSTHMVITTVLTKFSHYVMVHDDFGSHAANIEDMSKAIRRAFRFMYAESNPLEHWAKQQGIDTKELQYGEYNIDDIMQSEYFFS